MSSAPPLQASPFNKLPQTAQTALHSTLCNTQAHSRMPGRTCLTVKVGKESMMDWGTPREAAAAARVPVGGSWIATV